MFGCVSLDRFRTTRHRVGTKSIPDCRCWRAAIAALTVLYVAFPSIEALASNTDEAEEIRGASPQYSDQSIGILLIKVEHQIAAGHTLTPASDNAMDTWQDVITRMRTASPETLKTLAIFATHLRERAVDENAAGRLVAAADFAAFAKLAAELQARNGASIPPSEGYPADAFRSAGTGQASPSVAAPEAGPATSGTSLDGTNPPLPPGASPLPGRSSPADSADVNTTHQAASAAPAAPPVVASSQPASPAATGKPPPADTTGTDAVLPATTTAGAVVATTATNGSATPGKSPPTGATGAAATSLATATASAGAVAAPPQPPGPEASRQSSPASTTGTEVTPPAARPVIQARTAQEPPVAAPYVARGDQMLAIKDVSAARRFYEYAANAGSARAATALARTFDPDFLAKLGVIGLGPDRALAALWYRKAAALGDPDATTWLHNRSPEVAR